MDIRYLISLLVRVKNSIPFTCTSIREELQNQIDLLKAQAYPKTQYVEVVPMPDEEEQNEKETVDDESDS